VQTPGTPAGIYALSLGRTATVTSASSNELTQNLNLNLSVNSIRRSVDRGGSRTAPTNRSEIGDSARGFPTGRKWQRQFDASMYDFFLPVGKWLKMGLTCILGSELDYWSRRNSMLARSPERVARELTKVRKEGGDP